MAPPAFAGSIARRPVVALHSASVQAAASPSALQAMKDHGKDAKKKTSKSLQKTSISTESEEILKDLKGNSPKLSFPRL